MSEKTERPLCMACGEAPATSGGRTLPLCTACAALSNQAKRGVKYDKEKPPN